MTTDNAQTPRDRSHSHHSATSNRRRSTKTAGPATLRRTPRPPGKEPAGSIILIIKTLDCLTNRKIIPSGGNREWKGDGNDAHRRRNDKGVITFNISEDGIQDTEPIRFLELLGLDEEDLAGYSIRLNGSNPEWGKWSDLPDAYYSSYDDLMKWIFTKKWPDKDKATAQIHTRKVLQFIQLKPENPHPTQWLFVGAYDVLDEYTENDGKILYRYNEIPEYASLKARAVVYYKRDPGYTGVVFNLSNNEERRRDFLKTMTLEKIAQSPVSALPFPGYENVRLTHRQLVAAVNNEEWRAALGSVQAVYLQTDRRTGWHYVGSAYSRKGASHGLLSRWKEYASGDHSGGNKQLRNLGAGYIEKNFQYSILEIFDMNKSPKEIIDREHWWMDTLGSVRRNNDEVPHGYNSVAERENSDQHE